MHARYLPVADWARELRSLLSRMFPAVWGRRKRNVVWKNDWYKRYYLNAFIIKTFELIHTHTHELIVLGHWEFCMNHDNYASLYSKLIFRLSQGLISDEDEEHLLSPAEQRALRAEKRAAWRQARLKSLEQVKADTCASSNKRTIL